jgi:hypothetical protein
MSGLGIAFILLLMITGIVIWFGLPDIPFIIKLGVTAPCIGGVFLIILFGMRDDY